MKINSSVGDVAIAEAIDVAHVCIGLRCTSNSEFIVIIRISSNKCYEGIEITNYCVRYYDYHCWRLIDVSKKT